MKEKWVQHWTRATVIHPIRTLVIFLILTLILAGGLLFITPDFTFRGMLSKDSPAYSNFLTVKDRFDISESIIIGFWEQDNLKLDESDFMDVAEDLERYLLTAYGENPQKSDQRMIKKVRYDESFSYSESRSVKKARDKLRTLKKEQGTFKEHPEWDQPMFVVELIPSFDTDDMFASWFFVLELDQTIQSFAEKYPNLKFVLGGFPVLAKDEGEAMEANMELVFLLVIVGIILLFLFSLRRISFFFISLIPLVTGIIWSLGILGYTYHTINILSAMAPIILYGLGISYAIHWGVRFTESQKELGEHANYEALVAQTFRSISGGLLVGGMTTAGAFLSLLVSYLDGFAIFGVISSLGIISSLIAVFYILPILIVWQDKRKKRLAEHLTQRINNMEDIHKRNRLQRKLERNRNFLPTKPLRILGNLTVHRSGPIIGVAVIAVGVFFAVFINNIEIEVDAMKVEPPGLESLELEHRLDYKYGFTNYSTMLMMHVPDGQTLKEQTIAIRRYIMGNEGSEREGEPTYPGLKTVNIEYVVDFVGNGLSNKFRRAGWNYDPETWDEAREKIESGAASGFGGKLDQGDLKQLDYMVNNMVRKGEDGSLYALVTIYPTQYVWHEQYLKDHVADIHALAQEFDLVPAGLVPMWDEISTHMFNDIQYSILIAFGVILLLLLLLQRSFKGMIITYIPVVLAMAIAVGCMGFVSLKLNFINILGFPLILGLGIDYSVMFYQHFRHNGFQDLQKIASFTGKAILTAALTDIITIGAFIFTSHPGMSQFGLVLTIGITSALIGTLFVLPFFLRVVYNKKLERDEQIFKAA